jgi:hypothetical protein
MLVRKNRRQSGTIWQSKRHAPNWWLSLEHGGRAQWPELPTLPKAPQLLFKCTRLHERQILAFLAILVTLMALSQVLK